MPLFAQFARALIGRAQISLSAAPVLPAAGGRMSCVCFLFSWYTTTLWHIPGAKGSCTQELVAEMKGKVRNLIIG